MAIKIFNCNLNGGDSVTPNMDLFYRIYGLSDNFTSPIWTTGSAQSDPNVTVNGDVVIITGVDVGLETEFKIASVDEANNEGVLSDAYSEAEYKLVFTLANSEYLSFPERLLLTGDFYVEFRLNSKANTNTQYITGDAGNPALLAGNSANRVQWKDGDSNTYTTTVGVYPQNTFYTLKLVRTSGTTEFFIDGISQESTAIVTGNVGIQTIASRSGVYAELELEWFDLNGERFELTEGSGNTTTGSLGTVLTLNSTVSTDSMWVQI